MEPFEKMAFKDLKPHITEAIKQSCYRTEARLYNIANGVNEIPTFSVEPGVEIVLDLSKIIDKTIEDSIKVDCDLSVISQGILLGAFRSSPFVRAESQKTIRILVDRILHPVFKYKGDLKMVIEGLLSAILVIAMEFKLNPHESVNWVKEDILISAKGIDSKFSNDIKEILSTLDVNR
jgi:hypothetical protein